MNPSPDIWQLFSYGIAAGIILKAMSGLIAYSIDNLLRFIKNIIL